MFPLQSSALYGPLSPLRPSALYGPLSPLRPSALSTTFCLLYSHLSPLLPALFPNHGPLSPTTILGTLYGLMFPLPLLPQRPSTNYLALCSFYGLRPSLLASVSSKHFYPQWPSVPLGPLSSLRPLSPLQLSVPTTAPSLILRPSIPFAAFCLLYTPPQK
jgi:hypothetical protein